MVRFNGENARSQCGWWGVAVLVASCTGTLSPPRIEEGAGPASPGSPSVVQPPANEPKHDPGVPPVGPVDPQAQIPSDAIRGILSCPTVELPAFELDFKPTAGSKVSDAYSQACAGCHGGAGEGRPGAPNLQESLLTDAEFLSVVRMGRQAMPAFNATVISDVELRNDLVAIKALKGTRSHSSRGSVWTWPEAEYRQALVEGLVAWRKPDAQGAACANCHTPDAIDLAVIGYPDSAILRRGHEHLAIDDLNKVVRFVHAQRRTFRIAKPCSPLWRPFQPGGEVLPGNTPSAQELAFETVLQDRLPRLVSGAVRTLADAKAAYAELQAVDLRTTPIGIALPRWTEDGFNGEAHRTTNDYMPALPFIPRSKSVWYAKEDAYVADPTDQNLLALLTSFAAENDDGGFAKRQSKGATGNCYPYREAGSFITSFNHLKRSMQIVAQHFLRRELSSSGALRNQPVLLPSSLTPMNPFLVFGGNFVEPPCYDEVSHRDLYDTIPESMQRELPMADIARKALNTLNGQLTHPWMTLGQVLDPSFLNSDTSTNNKLQYWSDLNFSQGVWHEPFFYAHRIAQHDRHEAAFASVASGINGKQPSRYWAASSSPMLDGEIFFQMRVNNVVPTSERALFRANRFHGNVIRMFLLLQKEKLQQGQRARNLGTPGCDHGLCLANYRSKIDGFVARLRTELTKSEAQTLDPSLVADQSLFTTELKALADEVYGRLMP
jgi:mono/diheme cytochrome c family protein